MKKFYVAIFLMLFVSAVFAQQKARTGFYAGPALSTLFTKSGGETDRSKMKVGIYAGVLWDIPINRSLSVHSGLKFVQKGGMEKDEDYTTSIVINDLEVPVNLVYYSNGFKGSFFLGTGVSMAMSLSGKFTEKDNGDKYSEKLNFGIKDNDHLKSFDFGINALGGYEWKNGILVGVNYNYGFANLSNAPGDKIRTNYIALKFGYMLRKR